MSFLGDKRFLTILCATAVVVLATPTLISALRAFKRKRIQHQYLSSEFILAAGAVPFQFDSSGVPKRVLLIHHKPLDAWLLAKGRKDEGEDLATTALREVFEETGYACRLHPVPRLPTCAPLPVAVAGIGLQSHSARIAGDSTEPFMITLRPLGLRQLKLIFWYIGAVAHPYVDESTIDSDGSMQPGTHQLEEGFDAVKLFDINKALETLTFEGDRDIVRKAVEILTAKQ